MQIATCFLFTQVLQDLAVEGKKTKTNPKKLQTHNSLTDFQL